MTMEWIDGTPPGVRDALLDADALSVDTTAGSPLHAWARATGVDRSFFKTYLVSVALTYVPLAIAAYVGSGPRLHPSLAVKLPFFADWNVLFMFLVSFPFMVRLLVSDQGTLSDALKRVQRDGVLLIDPGDASRLVDRWRPRWFLINVLGYVIGIAGGIVISYVVLNAYAGTGYWTHLQSTLMLPGYIYIECLVVFWALIPIYVFRNIGITLFLRDTVASARLGMLPLHPDRCGGLRPIGRLGLRCQTVLMLLGLNLVAFTIVTAVYLGGNESVTAASLRQDAPATAVSLEPNEDVSHLIEAAAVGYVLIGPLVFIGPLMPFRNGMRRTKAELMGEVSGRLRIELHRLRKELPSGIITKDDEEFVERLRKIGAVVDELPVWPFDAVTLKSYVTTYAFPIIAGIYPMMKFVVSDLLSHLHL